MKIEIKRSELEAIRKKLEKDRGFFLSPCKNCDDDGVSKCEYPCKRKEEYEKLWTIFRVLEAYDIPNGFRRLVSAAAELEKAEKYYSESVASLDKQLSNLIIIEDLSTKHTVVKG